MNEKPEAVEPAPLEHFCDYLLLVARLLLGKQAPGKIGASDVVQQTFLQAYRRRDQFRGKSEAEMAAWLRTILTGVLTDAIRSLGRAKRDFRRERSLEEALEASSQLADLLVATQSTPNQDSERLERAIRLADALATLPEAQNEAIVMRYFEGLMVAEIGEQLNRTPTAVAGLLKRGLQKLRTLLSDCE